MEELHESCLTSYVSSRHIRRLVSCLELKLLDLEASVLSLVSYLGYKLLELVSQLELEMGHPTCRLADT